MSTNAAPLFDMSKAMPVQQPPAQPTAAQPLFDMSKAVSLTAPPKPQPAHDAMAGDLSTPANPGAAEGTYNMHGPGGIMVPVRYSRVHQALDSGLLFADKPTLQQYARDHAADPLDESRVDQWLDKHPVLGAPLNLLSGMGTGALKTATGLDKAPTSRFETELQMAAATPTKGMGQGVGEAGQNLGEFMSGEELLGFLGKAGGAVKLGEKLKDVSAIAQMAEKYPMIGKLLKIGASAAKQGTVGAAQTYAKTGDVGAATKTGLVTAAAGPVMEGLGAGYSAVKTAIKGPAEAEAAEAAAAAAREQTAAQNAAATEQKSAASRTEYGAQARAATEPHLQAINESRRMPEQQVMMNQPSTEENVLMNQPGGQPAVPTGRRVPTPAVPTGTMARPTETPQIDVDHVLNQIHDFTGAADHLTAVNDAGYNELDNLTNGRFRQLNGEVTAAQKAVWKGEEGAAEIYKSKQAQMDALIDSTATIRPEMKQALKASWRQSYMLRDFGNVWDRNLNGVPGASQASQAQRGINGKGLLTDLQRAVKMYGRPQIEESLGKGRLENLEQIAQENVTVKQRATFNGGVTTVAQELQKLEQAARETNSPRPEGLSPWGKRAVAMAVGGAAAHVAGASPYYGMVTAEGAYETGRFVLNALKTNPKIAQNFLFALQSGATAKRFGPFIATMIQQSMTESSLKQQRQQRQEAQQ